MAARGENSRRAKPITHARPAVVTRITLARDSHTEALNGQKAASHSTFSSRPSDAALKGCSDQASRAHQACIASSMKKASESSAMSRVSQ